MKKYITLALMLCIATTSMGKFKTWKTVTLGQQTRTEAIKNCKKQIGWFWEDGFKKIPISKTKKTLNLVLVTPKDLGLKFNDRGWWLERNYEKVLTAAKKKGLKECPQEVALLVWSDQKKFRNCNYGNQTTVIGTKLLALDKVYNRCLFMVDYINGESTSCLRLEVLHCGGDWGDPMYTGGGSDVRFVFVQ